MAILAQPPFRVRYAVLDLADDIGLVLRALRETLQDVSTCQAIGKAVDPACNPCGFPVVV